MDFCLIFGFCQIFDFFQICGINQIFFDFAKMRFFLKLIYVLKLICSAKNWHVLYKKINLKHKLNEQKNEHLIFRFRDDIDIFFAKRKKKYFLMRLLFQSTVVWFIKLNDSSFKLAMRPSWASWAWKRVTL